MSSQISSIEIPGRCSACLNTLYKEQQINPDAAANGPALEESSFTPFAPLNSVTTEYRHFHGGIFLNNKKNKREGKPNKQNYTKPVIFTFLFKADDTIYKVFLF